jgi:hypothetical protein
VTHAVSVNALLILFVDLIHLGCPIRKPYHTRLKRALPSLIRLACVRMQHRCQMLPQITCSLELSSIYHSRSEAGVRFGNSAGM